MISIFSLIFSIFSLYYRENLQEIPENNFPIIQMSQKSDEKNIFILSEKFATENPLENMKYLQNISGDIVIFECKNISVFAFPGDISLVENAKSQFFFSENMATGDFYDCENKKLEKYDFIEFGDGEKILQKIIFDENFYFSETCEGKDEKFEKYFSGKNGEKIPGNPENCEKIFKKYQLLSVQ